ncbi:MAG: thioredoxin family protein [Saprospiraceae bacterium]|nr:thioredoxin family protein [Saprospiraceae bacterium]
MRIFILTLFLVVNFISCSKDNNSDNPTSTQLNIINSLNDFDSRIAKGVTLAFFHATWCSKCAAQRPEVEGLIADSELQSVFFCEVDYEKNGNIVTKYNVTGFPTILLMKDGQVKHTLVGSNNKKADIKQLLKSL